MPSKVDESHDVADEPPTSIDPYKVLSVPQDASDDDVKKAYRKAALKNHPDKAADKDKTAAKERFQDIAFAYAILSDPRRRKRYDATGSTAESLDIDDDDFDWHSFYRQQFENVITEESINAHKREYQGSDEERQAILSGYTRGKGNMDTVYSTVMHSFVLDDDDRFRQIIDAAIAKGDVETYDRYTNESENSKERRRKNALRESKEAEGEAKKIKDKKAKNGVEEQSLAALIQQRQKGRESRFFEHLEEKYVKNGSGKGKGKKRSSAQMDEPPEEAFAATAARAKKTRK